MLLKNRWIILAASFAANLCIGSAYAWSVFQKPLIEMFGFSTSQASLAYTISLSLVPFAMILSGKLQGRIGARYTLVIGSIVFGVGIFLAGFTSGIAVLYLTYGFLGGVGIGIVYGCTIPNTVKWFPDRRGFAGGVIAGGFGFGSVVFAPLSTYLINSMDVLATFKIEGVVFFITIACASLLVTAPPPGYKPDGWEPPALAAGTSAVNLNTSEMVKTLKFWILWVMYTIGCVAGLMIIGHASPIGQEKIGISPEMAAAAVAFLGIANTAGRLLWGAISDWIGRYNTLILMYIVTGGMLLLLNSAGNYLIFVISVMGIALSFGGFMGVFPSITADNFGTAHLGINYGVMFMAFGLAAFVGPRLAASIRESSGDYSLAFIIASCMTIAGILCTIYVKISTKKKQ